MGRTKPLRPIATIIRPPLRKMTRTNLQLLGDPRGRLAGHQPLYRRELDLPVENPPFSCGHPAFLGTVFPVFVSHFRGALQRAITTSSLFRPGMEARLDGCATRAGCLFRFGPSEIACFFLTPGNGTFLHNKKPGTVARPALRITLTDIRLYLNSVTCVKRKVGAGEGHD